MVIISGVPIFRIFTVSKETVQHMSGKGLFVILSFYKVKRKAIMPHRKGKKRTHKWINVHERHLQ